MRGCGAVIELEKEDGSPSVFAIKCGEGLLCKNCSPNLNCTNNSQLIKSPGGKNDKN
jgi:hypothetical protein